MARLAIPLTDTRIRQTPSAAKPVKLADGGGMYLLLGPDSSRYWRLDYRFEGKPGRVGTFFVPTRCFHKREQMKPTICSFNSTAQRPRFTPKIRFHPLAFDRPRHVLAHDGRRVVPT